VQDVLPLISADRQRIQQVIYNLLSNAIKFTEPGGFVKVTLDVSEGATHGDSALRIAVADSGVGIKAEDQARIFDAFEQVDSSYARDQGGTGLGLALTRKLVELHSGTISVASEGVKGRGSVLTVRLPIPPAERR
jgi:signal transduction histidine kinase